MKSSGKLGKNNKGIRENRGNAENQKIICIYIYF